MEEDRVPLLANNEQPSPRSTNQPQPQHLPLASQNHEGSYESCNDDNSAPSITQDQTPTLHPAISTVPAEPFGWLFAAFIIINTLVGGGMLTFPTVVHKAGGVLPFIALIIVTGFITLMSCIVVGDGAQRIATRGFDLSFGQLCTSYFGPILGAMQNVLMIIACFGNITAYIKAIYGFMKVIIKSFSSEFLNKHPSSPYWGAIAVFLVVIFPMCFVRTVGKLKTVSAVMALNILYVVGISISFWLIHPKSNEENFDECGVLEWRPTMTLEALPAIFFAFGGSILASSIGAGLEPKGTKTLAKATVLACSFTVVCYIIVGVSLYLRFRCSLHSNLFLMLPADKWPVVFGAFLYLIKMSCEFPIFWYLNKLSMVDLLSQFRSFKGWEKLPLKTELRIRTILTIVITPIGVACALVTPDLYYLVTISGLCWIIVAFLTPPLLYLKMFKERDRLSQSGIVYWSKIALTYIWAAVIIIIFFATVVEIIADFKSLV